MDVLEKYLPLYAYWCSKTNSTLKGTVRLKVDPHNEGRGRLRKVKMLAQNVLVFAAYFLLIIAELILPAAVSSLSSSREASKRETVCALCKEKMKW